jgi:hypothetical protein
VFDCLPAMLRQPNGSQIPKDEFFPMMEQGQSRQTVSYFFFAASWYVCLALSAAIFLNSLSKFWVWFQTGNCHDEIFPDELPTNVFMIMHSGA